MTNRGKIAGLALVIILVVALLIASFLLKNMDSLGVGKDAAATEQENVVQQAQDLVDQINDRMQQAGQAP